MQNKSKRFILAGCLAASVAVTGLTGCNTEDRTAGNYLDDHEIAHRVASNLNHDPVYKFEAVKVNVFQGVAQLSGFVDTPNQIRVAAERASHTDGVREVINDIAIKPQFKLVPAAQEQSVYQRRWEGSGRPGTAVGETTGGYNQQNAPGAPVITPNQASPATPPTGDNQSYNQNENEKEQNQNQNQNYKQLNNQRGLNQDQNQRNP